VTHSPKFGNPLCPPYLGKGTMVHLSFYIFNVVMEFNLLIGQPIERLIQEGQAGKLKISLGKTLNFLYQSVIL
jgi:hypothetical protein